jgi:hypothetical protein
MKYYLIIGYQLWEKNKDFPLVRVYINGQMIDEFECDNEESMEISMTKTESMWEDNMCLGLGIDTTERFTFKAPKKFKMIEVDSSTWPDEGELTLEVLNNNSNYNNGFMSKRSMVLFNPIYLVSKEMHDNKSKMLQAIKRLYANRRNNNNIKIKNKVRAAWPGPNGYAKAYLFSESQFNIDHAQSISRHHHPNGGNFKFEFGIRKKYNMHMIMQDNWHTAGYFRLDWFFVAWWQNYTKNYFDFLQDVKSDSSRGTSEMEVELKEKTKQISNNNED